MTEHPTVTAYISFMFRQRDLLRLEVAGRDDQKLRAELVIFDEILAKWQRPALAKLKPSPSRD
jgi:hypothetical protein